MGELVSNLLELMSPETVKVFKDLNLKTNSDLATEEFNSLEHELEKIQIDAYERERNARIAMEEQEIKLLEDINKTFTAELERLVELEKSYELPHDSVATLKVKADIYNRKADVNGPEVLLDVCQLVDLHAEIESKEKQVQEIEKRLEKFLGLPPDISRAKLSIRNLTSEIEALETSANNELEEQVINFVNNTTLNFK